MKVVTRIPTSVPTSRPFTTVLEPYNAKCEDCGRTIKNTTKEFCPKCDGFLVDLRRLEIAEQGVGIAR